MAQTLRLIQGPKTDPDILVALMDAVSRLDSIRINNLVRAFALRSTGLNSSSARNLTPGRPAPRPA